MQVFFLKIPTNNVSVIPKIKTIRPYNKLIVGILKNILTQNVMAGAPIKNADKTIDDPSGPKTNLPPHKKFCTKKCII